MCEFRIAAGLQTGDLKTQRSMHPRLTAPLINTRKNIRRSPAERHHRSVDRWVFKSP